MRDKLGVQVFSSIRRTNPPVLVSHDLRTRPHTDSYSKFVGGLVVDTESSRDSGPNVYDQRVNKLDPSVIVLEPPQRSLDPRPEGGNEPGNDSYTGPCPVGEGSGNQNRRHSPLQPCPLDSKKGRNFIIIRYCVTIVTYIQFELTKF